MKGTSVHIIDKITIDIEVNSSDEAHEMQQKMQSFVNERILPIVEAYFEELAIPDIHVVLDKLDLQFDLDAINSPFWKEDVIHQLDKRFNPIQENIRSVESARDSYGNSYGNSAFQNQQKFFDEAGNVDIRSSSSSNLQAIGYFLSTGKAPWWMNTAAEGLPELLKEQKFVTFFEHLEFRTQIGKILRDQPNARKRFVLQFSDSVQMEWILQLTDPGKPNSSRRKVLKEALKIFENEFSASEKSEMWFAMHTYALERTLGNSTMKPSSVLEYLIKFVDGDKVVSQKQITIIQTLMNRFSKNEVIESTDAEIIKTIPGLFLFVSNLIDPTAESNGIVEILDSSLKNQSPTKLGGKNLKLNDKTASDSKISPSLDADNSLSSSTAKNSNSQSINDGPEKNSKTSAEQDSRTSAEQDSKTSANDAVNKPDSSINDTSQSTKAESSGQDSKNEAAIGNQPDVSINGTHKLSKSDSSDEASKNDSGTQNLASKLESEWSAKAPSKLSDFEHIDCAGGILLHPFYMPLFEHLKYLDEDRKLLEPQRAVHLMHFMITGESGSFESQMQFSKFICGLEPNETLDRSIVLTEKEKEQANNVLDSALGYWTALKSSSRELLQNEFLKRPGKITQDGDYLRIVVEKKTVDILLNQLPWNLTMVKLPWFESIVYVEWN